MAGVGAGGAAAVAMAGRQIGGLVRRPRLQTSVPVDRLTGVEDPRSQAAQAACVSGVDKDIGIQNLAAARVDLAWADAAELGLARRDPAHRGDADIEGLDRRVIGLDRDFDRVLEADAFEGSVPGQDAGLDRLAVLHRHAAVDMKLDRLDGLGNGRRGVFFLQPPTIDHALPRAAAEVARKVVDRRRKVAHALVGSTFGHRRFWQLGDRVVQADEHAAGIGYRARHAGHRRARRCPRHGAGDAAGRKVRLHVEDHLVGRAAHRRERGMPRVQAITLAEGRLQADAQAEQVAQEERVRLDQDRFGFRVRLAGDNRARQQAR